MAQNPNNLRVLSEAQAFCADCLPVLERLKKQGDFRMKEQIEASTTSVPSNLMEFCSMNSKAAQAEKLRCCIGETLETDSRLEHCRTKGLLTMQEFQSLRARNEVIRKQLYGLKKAVERS